VTTRAARSLRMFESDHERELFLAVLRIAVARAEWICLDYCLLGTHYHLIVKTPEGNIAAGMKRLNWMYSITRNRLTGHRGHLYEARYSSELIETDAHFYNAVRYLARNPVKAGLCDDPSEWRWSGYRALAGLEPPRVFHDVQLALAMLGNEPEASRRWLRWAVEPGAPAPIEP
jgi:REP element-mobilizing transposase RayT